MEFDAIHAGRTDYLAVSIALPDLLSVLGDEEHLADPGFWNTKRLCNPDPRIGTEMLRRLTGIIAGIEHKLTAPSDWAVDFFQRSIIEPFIVGLTSALPPASPRSYTGARLVTETEDYIDTAGGRPVHRCRNPHEHGAQGNTQHDQPLSCLALRIISESRSSSNSDSFPAELSNSAVAASAGEPPKNVSTRYRRAEWRTRSRETTGMYI